MRKSYICSYNLMLTTKQFYLKGNYLPFLGKLDRLSLPRKRAVFKCKKQIPISRSIFTVNQNLRAPHFTNARCSLCIWSHAIRSRESQKNLRFLLLYLFTWLFPDIVIIVVSKWVAKMFIVRVKPYFTLFSSLMTRGVKNLTDFLSFTIHIFLVLFIVTVPHFSWLRVLRIRSRDNISQLMIAIILFDWQETDIERRTSGWSLDPLSHICPEL